MSSSHLARDPIDILLVDPDPEDAQVFAEAFSEAAADPTVHIVNTGQEALNFVHQRGSFEDGPRPNIVVLDLELADTHGHEVLETLKNTPEFDHIPVVVLTYSKAEEDVLRSYDLNANAYMLKPDDPDELAALAESFTDFWLTSVELPPKQKQ